ncbi:MAG: DUF6807 family protein [Bryobacterales bacterium]|nr:DUF6807 family protein [Bryobacterales bacterium]
MLDYNYGPQLKPGVPEDRRREGYIYPFYTPAGVNPLDDFPADHFHHRGVFWAWMSIAYQGKIYDIWTLKPGIEHRFHKFLQRQATNGKASLSMENGWYVGDTLIVRETVELTVHPSAAASATLMSRLPLNPWWRTSASLARQTRRRVTGGFAFASHLARKRGS